MGVSQGQDLWNTVPRNPSLEQLKGNICREIRNIPQEIFPKVMTNMATCIQLVIGQRGAYVEHVVKKKKHFTRKLDF